jgi:hypothetical protein
VLSCFEPGGFGGNLADEASLLSFEMKTSHVFIYSEMKVSHVFTHSKLHDHLLYTA